MNMKIYKCLLVIYFSLILVKITAQVATNSSTSTSQTTTLKTTRCLTDVILKQHLLSNPALKHAQNNMNNFIANYQKQAHKTMQVLSIPVVVHIIHMTGPENISNQQVIDGIAHLNDAFANTGAYYNVNGVNTNIQFCLAQQDPSGGFTNGITRTTNPLTNLTAETDDAALKNIIHWNTNQYLNIWLVNEITSLSLGPAMAGYAMFPSSHGQTFDGIVNEAALFGSTIDGSKVHIHEAGHYLGLYHTFEGGCVNNDCQTDGDKVCDTPPDNSTAPVACGSSINTCTTDTDDNSVNNPFRATALGGIGDQTDMYKNYMDYGYQACQIYFTNGQSTRMNAALSTSRQSLLSSIGCVSACTIPVTLNIFANDSTVDIGTGVQFNSTTTNATILDWKINNVSINSTSSFTNTFNTPGTYVVSLTGSNSDASCNKTVTLSIQVNCTSQASFQFNTPAPFSPGSTINVTNTSQNSTSSQWILDGSPSSTTTNWSQVFNSVGGHSIYLISSNSLCSDTSSTSFFQIGNCNLSGVTNNWVFDRSHLNFSSGNPLNLGNASPAFSPNPMTEGSSTISDRDGNLLFFSDGINCWDKNYQLMPNGLGLMGHPSATQAVLITPHPGNPKQYYVFTNDAIENHFTIGLRYSIVDMSLNGGLGDIIPSTKNTLLLTGGSEKLTATWHANGHDIWVATAGDTSNTQYAYLIDNAGIHSQPITSNMGEAIEVNLGAMVFSQDGNRMASVVLSTWPWRILVADFNKSTGQFNNPIELVLSSVFNQQVFGLLFSPDNSKLYASLIGNPDVLQYDLSQTTASQIMASEIAIDPYSAASFGHMVLGKDGKIYLTSFHGGALDMINNPNIAGIACNYQPNGVSISSITTNAMCLPNMLQGYSSAFKPSIAGPKDICVGNTSNVYGILLESTSDVTVWSHTGPGTFTIQAGTNNAILTSASTVGTDTIRVKITGLCGTSYDTLVIHTNNPEIGLLSDTTFICDSVLLLPGTNFLNYEWQDVSNYPNYNVHAPGKYWVKMKGASGCLVTDTTRVVNYPVSPPVNLGSDKTICQGQIALLQTTVPYSQYQWQDGSINSTFSAYSAGKYWVNVTTPCGNISTDTIRVMSTQTNLNLIDTICNANLPVTINAPGGYSNYLWSNGASTQSLTITSNGTYYLKATDAQGCYSTDSVWVLNCSLVTGIKEFENGIYIFPNPADDKITLSSSKLVNQTVNIYSALGALVYTAEWNDITLDIPTSKLVEGIYFIRTELYNIKLLIKH